VRKSARLDVLGDVELSVVGVAVADERHVEAREVAVLLELHEVSITFSLSSARSRERWDALASNPVPNISLARTDP